MRKHVRHSRDRKIFRKTANKTKAVNVISKPLRGGTRL